MAVRLTVLVFGAGLLLAVPVAPTLHAKGGDSPDAAAESSRETLRDRLFRALKQARNAVEATAAANEIWLFWTQGPDRQATETIEAIFAARRAHDVDKALALAEKLTKRLPDYSEGWNQLATLHFVKGQPDKSLEAIERTLELEPKHFGALAGKAVILMQQGRVRLGQKALRRALKIHPFLPERSMLIEPPGRRI